MEIASTQHLSRVPLGTMKPCKGGSLGYKMGPKCLWQVSQKPFKCLLTFVTRLTLKPSANSRKKKVVIDRTLPAFFLLDAAWVRSRAERPSVSYTKVTAKSQGQAISCKHSLKSFKQISGNNKFLIAGDGKMKRMREP